jgi:hypothetical protein
MNIQTMTGTTCCINGKKVIIDNEEIPFPGSLKNICSTIIDNKIYLNGYEYIRSKKKFKRTFMAIFHHIF